MGAEEPQGYQCHERGPWTTIEGRIGSREQSSVMGWSRAVQSIGHQRKAFRRRLISKTHKRATVMEAASDTCTECKASGDLYLPASKTLNYSQNAILLAL